MAKNSRSRQKEACNQGKEDFKQLTYSRMHCILGYWRECSPVGALPNLKGLGKCALGVKGSNPLQGIPYVYPCLISSASLFGHVGRSFPPPRSSFVIVVERAGTKDYISNV